MTPKVSCDREAGLGDTLQSLIVSGIRLSAGLTLYRIGQLQKVFDAATGDKGLLRAAEKLDSTFRELSGSLEVHMDETRKEALRSVARVSAKALEKAFESFDPGAILGAGSRLLGRHEDTLVNASPVAVPLAVDVLSGPPDFQD